MAEFALPHSSECGPIEAGIGNVVVYDDVNNNGKLDLGEPFADSDNLGLYQLYLGASGSATIRQVVPNGDAQEVPASNGSITVQLNPNSQIESDSNDFVDAVSTTDKPLSATYDLLRGQVVNQTLLGANPPGLSGVQIYDDVNNNGAFDAGEPLATTDSSGDYSLLLPIAGTAHLRQVLPLNFIQTSPADGAGYDVNLASPTQATGLNFDDYYQVAVVGQFAATASSNAAGSYNNLGNTVANAADGNIRTYFDAPTPSGNYVQLDLGTAKTITQIAYAPRAASAGVDYESRMVGGYFEASNDPSFAIGDVVLYTVTSEPGDGLTTQNVSVSGTYEYVRYVSPSNSYGNIAEFQVFGPGDGSAAPATPIAGTPSANTTSSYYGNPATTYTAAFDDNTDTYFDAPTANGNYVQLDLGAAYNLTQLAYAPRPGFDSRMIGGIFEASNDATFATGVVTLFTVSTQPTDNLITQPLSISGAYRYVRYVSPANSYGNIAEMQLFGTPGTATPVSTKLTGTESANTTSSYDGQTSDNYTAAFDGSTSTFFDAPTANGNWVQLDLGSAKTITSIAYAPRAASKVYPYEARMVGGIFEASNDPTFATGVVTLYTVAATPLDGLNTENVTVGGTFQYIRYVSPAGSYGNIAEMQVFGSAGTTPVSTQLTVTASANTTASYDGSTSDNYTAVVDGNTSTFFDAPTANGNWVQLDLGSAKTITSIAYAPRAASKVYPYEARMVGGIFEASNDPTFASGVTVLDTITSTPPDGLTTVTVNPAGTFRYVRYLAPDGSYGNIAEIQLFGY